MAKDNEEDYVARNQTTSRVTPLHAGSGKDFVVDYRGLAITVAFWKDHWTFTWLLHPDDCKCGLVFQRMEEGKDTAELVHEAVRLVDAEWDQWQKDSDVDRLDRLAAVNAVVCSIVRTAHTMCDRVLNKVAAADNDVRDLALLTELGYIAHRLDDAYEELKNRMRDVALSQQEQRRRMEGSGGA